MSSRAEGRDVQGKFSKQIVRCDHLTSDLFGNINVHMLRKMLLMLIWISGFIFVLALGVFVFVWTAPQFGATAKGEALSRNGLSPNYIDGQFQNLTETRLDMDLSQIPMVMWEMFTASESAPSGPLPTRFTAKDAVAMDSALHFTWFGHSSVLIEIDGKRILVDPMFGEAAAPLPIFSRRFPLEKPIPIQDIRDIDAVIISHDHYDHLDYGSILALKEHVGHFYTALGVGEHLKRWGVEEDQITELDWWSKADLKGLEFVCTPARHFSGRSLTDRNKSLWASWVIKGRDHSLFFSGDSGYADHFKEIGKRHGPFDLAFIECGQYNVRWEAVHMMPEQSVLAAEDLKANFMMPIHWGSFRLSSHPWTDPVKRVIKEASVLNQKIIHPFIGERINVKSEMKSTEWWHL